MCGKLVNKYIALMQKPSLTEPLLGYRGLTSHRGRLQSPLHVGSELRAKIDILPLSLLETY